MPNNKAPGPDEVPNEVIRHTIRLAPTPVLRVFDKCLKSGVFPASWKKALLVLLRKDLDKPVTEPTSFRHLCMLDGLGKVLERIILKRLNAAVEAHGGLSDNQFGFTKG